MSYPVHEQVMLTYEPRIFFKSNCRKRQKMHLLLYAFGRYVVFSVFNVCGESKNLHGTINKFNYIVMKKIVRNFNFLILRVSSCHFSINFSLHWKNIVCLCRYERCQSLNTCTTDTRAFHFGNFPGVQIRFITSIFFR